VPNNHFLKKVHHCYFRYGGPTERKKFLSILSIYLCVCLYVYLPTCPFIHLSYLSIIYVSMYLSVYVSTYLSVSIIFLYLPSCLSYLIYLLVKTCGFLFHYTCYISLLSLEKVNLLKFPLNVSFLRSMHKSIKIRKKE
jgi:hypothetical protein